MGNFSRNTFNFTKNYVGVRLQQGVPLVDADWNELNDVIRYELYNGLYISQSDGVARFSEELRITDGFFRVVAFDANSDESAARNDFIVTGGYAIIGGRPFFLNERAIQYSQQPWYDDREQSDNDNVAFIPSLEELPEGVNRLDTVYLDVWERETTSDEDPSLINPNIGLETAVRLKREAAVRLLPQGQRLPAGPAGHLFLPLATIRRNGSVIQQSQIKDIRPFIRSPRGFQSISFVPAFHPYYLHDGAQRPAWIMSYSEGNTSKFHARSGSEGAFGILPLTLPEGAKILKLWVSGYTEGRVSIRLLRILHPSSPSEAGRPDLPRTALFDQLISDAIPRPTGRGRDFKEYFQVISGLRGFDSTVDNSRYYYLLDMDAPSLELRTEIHGVSITFEY